MYAIFDTETINATTMPFIYDFGMTITDGTGKIFDRYTAIVSEIARTPQLFNRAFYQWKKPIYILRKNIVKSFHDVMADVAALLDKWEVHTIGAYNLAFDLRAINKTMDFLTIKGKFFQRELNFVDLWSASCETIFSTPDFIEWAENNGYISDANNIKTNAEVAFCWTTKNVEFSEAHVALDDAEIESVILAACIADGNTFTTNRLIGSPWRIVANYREWLDTFLYLEDVGQNW